MGGTSTRPVLGIGHVPEPCPEALGGTGADSVDRGACCRTPVTGKDITDAWLQAGYMEGLSR